MGDGVSMQIIKYSNEQFAGSRDLNVMFAPGMNVVLGKNETGKSTMIEGIYDTLFMHSRLDGRKDKEFLEQRFPTNGGNCIDGTVRMIASGQEITIKKEWDKGNTEYRTSLVLTESGTKFTGTVAEKKMEELLPFGSAVFDYIVFGRQNNERAVMDWFYSFMKEDTGNGTDESMTQVREKIAGAMSAAGGISEDLFLQKLDARLEELASHWDVSLDAPEKNRGIQNPWGVKVGEILQAYYDRERKKREVIQARNLLEEVENQEAKLDELRSRKATWVEKQNSLRKLQNDIEKGSVLSERSKELSRRLTSMQKAEMQWPKLLEESEYLKILETETKESEIRKRKDKLAALIEQIKQLEEKRQSLVSSQNGLEHIESHSLECRKLETELQTLVGTLTGAGLHVKMTLKQDIGAVLSSADGNSISIERELDEDVKGFARIVLPQIGEILVTPQNLKVEEIQARIEEIKARLAKIYQLYHVKDGIELEEVAEGYRKNGKALQTLELQLSKVLLGRTTEEIRDEYEALQSDGEIQIRENLNDCIQSVLEKGHCKTLAECRASVMTQISGYIHEYESPENLIRQIKKEQEKLSEIEAELAGQSTLEMTREEFQLKLNEAEIMLNGRDGKSGLNREIEETIAQSGRLSAEAESIDLDALEQEISECEQLWNQKKKLYRQYLRIKEDFLMLRSSQGNKYDSFYRLFDEKLSIITDGNVRWTDACVLKSRGNVLTGKELLSKGTRQVILLAFRLAVLEFYYKEEGGVLVMDDVLLDMDPERREKAVRLLQDFAGRNQVIFTTCDPAMASLFDGNIIQM